LEYRAPEIIRAILDNRIPIATYAVDMFAIGRVIQWLSSSEESFWPHLKESEEDVLEAWIGDMDAEFDVTEDHVPHTTTLNVVLGLIKKHPDSRMTLKRLQISSYLMDNIDTRALNLSVSYDQRMHSTDTNLEDLQQSLNEFPYLAHALRQCMDPCTD
jgi:hypothetical protein